MSQIFCGSLVAVGKKIVTFAVSGKVGPMNRFNHANSVIYLRIL